MVDEKLQTVENVPLMLVEMSGWKKR